MSCDQMERGHRAGEEGYWPPPQPQCCSGVMVTAGRARRAWRDQKHTSYRWKLRFQKFPSLSTYRILSASPFL